MIFSRKPAYNFTEEVRAALSSARLEAARLGHEYVGTEHLLLGLIADEGGIAVSILRELGVEPESIRQRMLDIVKRGKAVVHEGEPNLPYTSRAKKVLELSMEAARDLSDNYVGCEHLLLGLIGETKGIAAQVLADAGATLQATRAVVVRLRGTAPRESGEAERSQFRFQIDDRSDRSIAEQIVAQAQEAVATGTLKPGDRMPTVRQLADGLDIAPGTVARAYSELERLGVIVTEGARGTRVAERTRPAMPDAKRPETLVGLLRPVAVAAFHLGASATEVREALERAMGDIFGESNSAP
jgi:DNA-binding transcriptional regulator YhcF (GntR family)